MGKKKGPTHAGLRRRTGGKDNSAGPEVQGEVVPEDSQGSGLEERDAQEETEARHTQLHTPGEQPTRHDPDSHKMCGYMPLSHPGMGVKFIQPAQMEREGGTPQKCPRLGRSQ